MRENTLFVNLHYPPTKEAKLHYDYLKSPATLWNPVFVNSGSLIDSQDQWVKDNVQFTDQTDHYQLLNPIINENSVFKHIFDNLENIDSKYIGFAHYRLFLSLYPSDIDQADIWVTEPIQMRFWADQTRTRIIDGTIEDGYKICHIPEAWDIFEQIVHKTYLGGCFNFWATQHSLNAPCNLFLMRKELFENYCEILFLVLDQLLVKIDLSKPEYQTKYQHRQLAFLSERLFSLWVFYRAMVFGDKVGQIQSSKYPEFKPFSDMQEREMRI